MSHHDTARRIWVISDTHFKHENMYKFLTADGVTRVRHQFQNAKEADEAMIAIWNAQIGPYDIVYHLGDVGFTHEAVMLLRGCQGRLRVVLGNHDPEDPRLWRDAGVEKVYGMKRLFDCWLTHCPMHMSNLGGPRVLGNIHGHIHHQPSPRGPYHNACVEMQGYRAWDFEEIRELIKKKVEKEATQDVAIRQEVPDAHNTHILQEPAPIIVEGSS